MRRRRQTEVFSLSFLDCICCGFGAVVLFYTVMSANIGQQRLVQHDELTAEVHKLEEQVLDGSKNLVVLRNTLQTTHSEKVSGTSRATLLIEELQRKREELSVYDAETTARRAHIGQLKADVKALDAGTRRLEAGAIEKADPGNAIARKLAAPLHYLTGLAMRGQRILILLDVSASMLDDDLVGVIKLRNSGDVLKRSAPKWRRALRTVSWLTSRLPATARYQIYVFNTQSHAVLNGNVGQWLSGGDATSVADNNSALRAMIPAGGTSLINGLNAIRRLSPAPDQVILITDGLPTQGATAPALRRYISAKDRQELFDQAMRATPRDVPIDVVLLPMSGEVGAPHAFWTLARATGGIFLEPARDWP